MSEELRRSGRAISILFIDGEAVVIDKPAGLPCGRTRRDGPSVEAMLGDFRQGFARDPMLVHRLDTDTSGCLLLARNPRAAKRFGAVFEARRAMKSYIGVVAGVPKQDSGVIDLPLSKISTREAGWRIVADPEGKPARTRWRKLDDDGVHARLLFEPETGRTHQLRVHAATGLGMPLLGDPLYGCESGAAPRMMLHAHRLAVPREGKPDIEVEAPLPSEFTAFGVTGPRAQPA